MIVFLSHRSSLINCELTLREFFDLGIDKVEKFTFFGSFLFQEDLSEHIVQGDALPGHVGTACLLSSTIAESGKSAGILTLPIMSRNSRKTIGKVRVDFIIIKPIPGYSCDMKSSFSKYWKPRIPLDVGHRGAGNSTTTAQSAQTGA